MLPTCLEFSPNSCSAVLRERLLCFPGMSTAWRVMLLSLCICIWLPAQVSGALVVSRRDAQTEVGSGATRIRSIQKRSPQSTKMVEVFSVTVGCTVTSRFARTVMTSKARNRANTSQEIFFEVELPKTAFITNFSMEIDGQVYVGAVKEKEKAKKEYEKAVSSGKTAGLVKASGRKMEKFSVSANIEAQTTVSFVLTYEELLQRKLGQYEILMRVKPKQPVQEFQIVADIYEPQGLAFVDTTASFLTNDLLSLVEKTIADTKARISFSPTLEQQQKCAGCEGSIIDGDFIIKYDVKREKILGDIQVVNGYFVHFFAPPDLPRVPKNVVFVIDRSGSMSGQKMKQTREALEAILNDLHKEDHFALIAFDDKILTWRPTLTKATNEDVSAAINYVRGIQHSGATNLNGAVLKGVRMLKKERQEGKLPERSSDMIVLLTDGMPNHGESSLPVIQANVQSAIDGTMSMFCLGFGNDVDYSFLDVMCRQNKGFARRIFEGSDAALQLQGFYDEVSSPLLLDVNLRYSDNAVDLVTKSNYSHLFNGSEIVVAGQMDQNVDLENFLVEVLAKGPEQDFVESGKARVVDFNTMYPDNAYIFGDFSERLWAYLTIQQLLENSDLGTQEERDARKAKALNMSLKYDFVTPLTSMVVTKPETEEGQSSPLIADKLTEGQRQMAERGSSRSSGARIVPVPKQSQSRGSLAVKGSSSRSRGHSNVDGDPHFLIELPERGESLCFNIDDKPGTIFNLVTDTKSGFVVNGQIISKHKVAPGGPVKTYFGRLGISHHKLGLRLEVSTRDISVFHDGKRVKLLWSDAASIKENKFKGVVNDLKEDTMDLSLVKNCSLTVALRHSVKFVVIRHTKVWKRHGEQQDYLGFYNLDSHHLSPSVHGLLGQFYHGLNFEVADLRPGGVQENQSATMYVKGQTLNVTRHWQKDFSVDVKDGDSIHCWFINNNGTGLIDGKASDYVVPGLFTTAT